MELELFNYNLPKEFIAKRPASPRDSAKLLVYNRSNTKVIHDRFYNIDNFLQKGDVLVLNNTKVIPARLIGKRIISPFSSFPRRREPHEFGRKFKILLLEKKKLNIWTALIDGRGREVGLKLFFSKNLKGEIVKKLQDGIWEIRFNQSGKKLEKLIFELGQMPLPPYIKQKNIKTEKHKNRRTRKQENKRWYQTVYAKYIGSVAAPTAGLHFTNRLIKKLKKRGVQIEYITLHVGLGTFLPVKTENIKKHKMHSEFASISKETAKKLNKAKEGNRKIIAVGTTTARTLEAFTMPCYCEEHSDNGATKQSRKSRDCHARVRARNDGYCLQNGSKDVDIFIYPPYVFKYVDAMITNFHLPKSTLLMMISAFLSEGDTKGIKIIKKLYQEAIKKKYRFYSYGDTILIL